MSEQESITKRFNTVAEEAEKIGYLRAFNDLLDEFNRIGMKEAAIAVALFAKSKGIAK